MIAKPKAQFGIIGFCMISQICKKNRDKLKSYSSACCLLQTDLQHCSNFYFLFDLIQFCLHRRNKKISLVLLGDKLLNLLVTVFKRFGVKFTSPAIAGNIFPNLGWIFIQSCHLYIFIWFESGVLFLHWKQLFFFFARGFFRNLSFTVLLQLFAFLRFSVCWWIFAPDRFQIAADHMPIVLFHNSVELFFAILL